jgi:hypothetical protein
MAIGVPPKTLGLLSPSKAALAQKEGDRWRMSDAYSQRNKPTAKTLGANKLMETGSSPLGMSFPGLTGQSIPLNRLVGSMRG